MQRIIYLIIDIRPFLVDGVMCYDVFIYPGATVDIRRRILEGHFLSFKALSELPAADALRRRYIKLFNQDLTDQDI